MFDWGGLAIMHASTGCLAIEVRAQAVPLSQWHASAWSQLWPHLIGVVRRVLAQQQPEHRAAQLPAQLRGATRRSATTACQCASACLRPTAPPLNLPGMHSSSTYATHRLMPASRTARIGHDGICLRLSRGLRPCMRQREAAGAAHPAPLPCPSAAPRLERVVGDAGHGLQHLRLLRAQLRLQVGHLAPVQQPHLLAQRAHIVTGHIASAP
jgi:hypothetical protein